MQNPRTALPEQSIWLYTPERVFRQRLVEVEHRTNAVPTEPQLFDSSSWHSVQNNLRAEGHVLPLKVEKQVADDFAYVAAVREGAQSVAAVCVEECAWPVRCLKLSFAAVDTLDEATRNGLRSIANNLEVTHNTHNLDMIQPELAKIITELHYERLLGRLRSTKWSKPPHLIRSHKKPLWQDFPNVTHRVQFVYPSKRHKVLRRDIEERLDQLARIYQSFEMISDDSNDIQQQMFDVVSASYKFCMHPSVQKFSQDLEKLRPTAQIAAALKCLHQVEKVGAYVRIAKSLANTAQAYPSLFAKIDLIFLEPYSGVSTDVAYEPWAHTCHVHAEIQLIANYDIKQAEKTCRGCSTPRVIGTSKYLCVLCFLFIEHDGRYFPANTHGRIYDQWTVPDLSDFSDEVRNRYRQTIDLILKSIHTFSQQTLVRRVEPMTSRQNLLSSE